MNVQLKLILAALAFGGSVSAASAAGVITSVTVEGGGGGAFAIEGLSDDSRELDLSKTFNNLDPIVLTFTVAHSQGPGNPYVFTESITNNTGENWLDYHFAITEPATGGQGVVFTGFNGSTLSGFTLDSSSGPRGLDFTGGLANQGVATASFSLSPFDPGAGNTATFQLTQVATIPEPETYAMLLAGLGLMGFMARRRSGNENS